MKVNELTFANKKAANSGLLNEKLANSTVLNQIR